MQTSLLYCNENHARYKCGTNTTDAQVQVQLTATTYLEAQWMLLCDTTMTLGILQLLLQLQDSANIDTVMFTLYIQWTKTN